jgi:ABC-type Mn2+/Zn2+ transport system ATPase subunit/GNAT superfamily N-acetyltransferase
MPTIDIVIESERTPSYRCEQLGSMFDVPIRERERLEWKGELSIEALDWNVGLIVGPSGSGKSVIAKQLFKAQYHKAFKWQGEAVIDDFDKKLSIAEIAEVCQAVGFNTIPAWFRPYKVLSNGEKFRVDLARRLIEQEGLIVVDEFTSTVDRQVAKIGAYAVQKYARKNKKRFVGVSCHYDIIDWLMPDWTFDPTTMQFKQKPRGLLQRPKIKAEIKRVGYKIWRIFAPYHYLTVELNHAAKCYALFIEQRPVAFIGVLHNPNKDVNDIKRISRAVTLPDWQGLGLIFKLMAEIAAAYKALGFRLRAYPAHPPFVRAMYKTKDWNLMKAPGIVQKTRAGYEAPLNPNNISRPCAIFEYRGEPMSLEIARKLIEG